MTNKRMAFAAGLIGLFVAAIMLTLEFWGVSGVLFVGNVDLMHVLWPSSIMLVVGWHSTVRGIMITASSVAINCLLYIAIVFALREAIRFVMRVGGRLGRHM